METRSRMPLHDLALEQFLIPPIATASKTPQKYKRPLSPSRTPLNPAKRRVLDAERTLLANRIATPLPIPMRAVTPNRPSQLGNGLARNPQATSSLSLHPQSPSREPHPVSAESSIDPQSRHYPGFDIFRDSEHCRGTPVPGASFLSGGDAQVDRSDEDKENVPPRRKAKKLCPKKRLSGLDGSDISRLRIPTQLRAVRSERTPFSTCQALR